MRCQILPTAARCTGHPCQGHGPAPTAPPVAEPTFAFACGVFDCSVAYTEDTVKVTSSRKR